MAGYRQGKRSWVEPDFYPVEERLGRGFKSDEGEAVLIIDVGGGMGHDLEVFKAKHPGLASKGRLILQEREEAVSQTQGLSSGIEVAVHDFFTEQPVKGETVTCLLLCRIQSLSLFNRRKGLLPPFRTAQLG